MRPSHVIVVGGGLAGLQAAIACADAGARVSLFERRRRLGGLTWSKPHRGLGFEVDNGQHVFMRCCDQYLGFLDRLGMRDRVVLQDRLSVPVKTPGEPAVWIRGSAWPAPVHLAPSLLRFTPLSGRARLRVARAVHACSKLDPDDRALDDRTLGSWLAERNALGDEAFWDLLIRSTLNTRARDASLALAAKVIRTGFIDRADGADVGWSRVPLGELHAASAERALRSRGAALHLGAAIDAIEATGSSSPSVRVGGQRVEADAVIVAVPHFSAAALLRPYVRDGDPSALGHSPIVNLHAAFDRPVMAVPLLAGMNSELQWIFDRSERHEVERGQYLTVSLSAAEDWLGLSHDALRRRFLSEIHALLPASRAARLTGFAVIVERKATFLQTSRTRRHRLRPGALGNGLYVAGAWTDTGWPATMESAVRSGRAAAADVIRDLIRSPRSTRKEAA